MGESLLITLREGFEAALVLAAVRRSDRPGMARWVWAGTAAAAALAAALGVLIHLTIEDLEGQARARVFALICVLAGGLLTWMIFWMRTHSRSLKGELEGMTSQAMEKSAFALAMVAFLAVLREGLETALFLVSTATGSTGADVLAGGLIGVAAACVLGALVYHGSRRVPVRQFFQITGLLLILCAAGLFARAVLFLQVSGDLGSFDLAAYNLTQFSWLTTETQSGRFLAGIFGWDPRPSVEQVVVYLGYLVPVLVLFFMPPKAASAPPPPASTHAEAGFRR